MKNDAGDVLFHFLAVFLLSTFKLLNYFSKYLSMSKKQLLKIYSCAVILII